LRDPTQARLAAVFLLGKGAARVDVLLDIPGNELAVAPYPSIQINKMVVLVHSLEALGDLLSLRA